MRQTLHEVVIRRLEGGCGGGGDVPRGLRGRQAWPSRVGRLDEAAGLLALLRPAAEIPVTEPEAHAVGRDRDPERTEFARRLADEELLVREDLPGRAVARDLEAEHFLPRPVGEEEVPAVLFRERVFVVRDGGGP